MNELTDFEGQVVNVGDTIILVQYMSSGPINLFRGKITEIKKVGVRMVAYVDGYRKGVSSQMFYKVSE